MNRSQHTKAGFSLVELMFALAIFVIAITGIFAVFSTATSTMRKANNDLQVALIAEEAMARAERSLDRRNPLPRDVQGWKEAGFPSYMNYDINFSAIDPTNLAFRVEVTVHWIEKGDPRKEVFESILLRK